MWVLQILDANGKAHISIGGLEIERYAYIRYIHWSILSSCNPFVVISLDASSILFEDEAVHCYHCSCWCRGVCRRPDY